MDRKLRVKRKRNKRGKEIDEIAKGWSVGRRGWTKVR